MVQDGNSSDISEFGSWLMFEGSPRANMLDADQCLPYTQPKVGQANLVTQPPIIPEMLEAATDRSKPFTRRGMARVHETQFATSYLTKDWALYSQLEADTTLNADGTLKIKDLDNGGVPSNDWSSERWAVLWDETGAAGLTMKAPTGYGWCPGCGLGPHEDIVQHEGTITGIFNIPTTWTWQYTNDSIPTNTTAVINDVRDHRPPFPPLQQGAHRHHPQRHRQFHLAARRDRPPATSAAMPSSAPRSPNTRKPPPPNASPHSRRTSTPTRRTSPTSTTPSRA